MTSVQPFKELQMDADDMTEVLCDAVHGTMKAAHQLAQEEGVSPKLWAAILEGARLAMDEAYAAGYNDAAGDC